MPVPLDVHGIGIQNLWTLAVLHRGQFAGRSATLQEESSSQLPEITLAREIVEGGKVVYDETTWAIEEDGTWRRIDLEGDEGGLTLDQVVEQLSDRVQAGVLPKVGR